MTRDTFGGLLAAGGAFLLWGVLPVYWRGLSNVPAMEILCHRIVWSGVFVAALLTLQHRWGEIRAAVTDRRVLLSLVGSSLLIGGNWWLFIWSVTHNRVVEASLGYYINPLVNVLLGFLVFRDKLDCLRGLAILLATTGVGYAVWNYGHLPWISLTLGFTFGLYGLVRKVANVAPMPGLFVETVLLAVPAAWWLGTLQWDGTAALFHQGPMVDALLLGAGVVTSTPLILFAQGARKLRLGTLGVVQYLSPTTMLLLGIFLFGEPFGVDRLVTFLFIWAGAGVYLVAGLREQRQVERVLSR